MSDIAIFYASIACLASFVSGYFVALSEEKLHRRERARQLVRLVRLSEDLGLYDKTAGGPPPGATIIQARPGSGYGQPVV